MNYKLSYPGFIRFLLSYISNMEMTHLQSVCLCHHVYLSPKDQALLVGDQFVVTFDGQLYELPGSCPLLLAQDLSPNPSFTLLLSSGLLLIELNDTTIHIQHNGQVCVC